MRGIDYRLLVGSTIAAGVLMPLGAGAADAPEVTAAEVLRIRWVNPPQNPPTGIRHATFASKAVKAEVGYNIYLPDAYEAEPERRFPVIYFLHGSRGHESRTIHVAANLHRAIEAGEVEPVVMVFANGGHNTAYLDSVDGSVKASTLIMEELIPHIDANYRTIADRGGRAIEGFSMGGGGALRFALTHPDRFSSVVVYGAGGMRKIDELPTIEDIRSPGNKQRKMRVRMAIVGTDIEHWRESNSYYIAAENADRVRGRVGVRMVIGTEDFSIEGAHTTQDRLDELKIPHEYELIGGVKHNIRDLYEYAGLRGLRFHQRWFERAAGN